MRSWPTRMLPLGLVALLLAGGGCSPGKAQSITPLPDHVLEFGPTPAPSVPASQKVVRHRVDDPWSVRNPRPWRYIVIHHTATDSGNAETFDAAHRARGWDELGYHFVITNGAGGADGKVEVGPRWRKQKWGAHTGGTPDNEYNNFGVGIGLVGDFRRTLPSAAQLQSLRKLTCYLAERYRIPPEAIIGHRDAPDAATKCPGDALHRYIHATLRSHLRRSAVATSP